jgi:pyruvate/2-oxoglutarate dehydrogenase complex dihydrolipoamide dehydrogenase (E3) component
VTAYPIDYDLTIIGGTSAGIHAAIAAARCRARVALVAPKPWNTQGLWLQQGLYEFLHRSWATGCAHLETVPERRTEQAARWTNSVVSTFKERYSVPALSLLGIDVIIGSGEFHNHPYLQLRVGDRCLRSRAYLLAMTAQPTPAAIPGLVVEKYLTPEEALGQLLQPSHLENQHWLVIGDDPTAVEVSQLVARCGIAVTLLAPASRLLPLEDQDVSALLQAQFEAEGITVLTGRTLRQVQAQGDRQQVSISNKMASNRTASNSAVKVSTLMADEIVWCDRDQVQWPETLNLATAGVKQLSDRLVTNPYLQTTNPQIYTCGSSLGGYDRVELAHYEAAIAVKNALFGNKYSCRYHPVAWSVNVDPALARVGLTETQAQAQYPQRVLVSRQSYKYLDAAQSQGNPLGFCKLIAHKDGRLLGGTLLGTEATALISTLSLAISQQLKLQDLARLATAAPIWAELLWQTAAQF